ncbi:MAG: hypothetical protein EZS28_052455, partial [Streblomastix strix]
MKFSGTEEEAKEYKITLKKRIEREHCNTGKKRINQTVQPNIHDKESKREMEKDTGCD